MRADAHGNRQRLLVAAREVFAEQGADASLNEVVRRAHVGPGTLYRHFATREALVEAVFRDNVDALCARAYELGDALPADVALACWLRTFVRHAVENRGLAASIALTLRAGQPTPHLAGCHDALLAAGGHLLGAAQDAGLARVDVTASDLLTLANALVVATVDTAADSPGGPPSATADGPSEQTSVRFEQGDRLLALVADGWRLGGSVASGSVAMGRAGAPQQR